MNKTFAAFFRHFLTFLTGIGGTLATANVIIATDAAAVDAAGMSLIAPLSVIGGAIAAGLTRMVMGWLGLGGLEKNLPTDDDTMGQSGQRLMGFLLLAGMGGIVILSLPSCSSPAGADMPPIHATYRKDGVTLGYSSKAGLSVDVDQTSRK